MRLLAFCLVLILSSTCFASDFYEEKLVVCKCKLNEDKTNAVLDLPMKIYHQEVVANGVKYGPYPLPKSLDGKEVLALITYAKKDIEVYDKFTGQMVKTVTDSRAVVEANKTMIVNDFQKDVRVDPHWSVTKAEAYATVENVVDAETGDVSEVVKPYTGEDSTEKAPFYAASEVFEAKPVEPIIEEPIDVDK